MSTANNSDTAIVAISKNGAQLGRKLRFLLPFSQLYVSNKFSIGDESENSFSTPVGRLIKGIFHQYSKLVLIMAVGIAVRSVAPYLNSKLTDAAVVVMDESGKYAVSLLSGHIGGANELADRLGSLTGALPVITTSSDSQGLISLDMLAKQSGWKIMNPESLTQVSAALVNAQRVGFYQDAGNTDWSPQELSPHVAVFDSMEKLKRSHCRSAVVITDKDISEGEFNKVTVIFHPKSLVVGIGCNSGTGAEEIEDAIKMLFIKHNLAFDSIAGIATSDIKKNESGIIKFARKHKFPLVYFDKASLSRVVFPSKPSPAALKHVGLTSVCEAAAILSSGDKLILPKTIYHRKITLAVARQRSPKQKSGKLYIVGIGPGDAENMSVRARNAIAVSDSIIGYSTYIDLIKPFISGKEIIKSSMGKEVERVNLAIERVNAGKTVSLISSGDPGIYGMSGLAMETVQHSSKVLNIEVIPGIPAALSAASLLGAPLNVDIAFISLSDYLVSWDGISSRLKNAANQDFIIALYNPKSRMRKQHLAKARSIILENRSPATPVGIVTNAYRNGQSVVITSLKCMLDHEINMDTIIIIGNSSTMVAGGQMLTPRGYSGKYSLTGDKNKK